MLFFAVFVPGVMIIAGLICILLGYAKCIQPVFDFGWVLSCAGVLLYAAEYAHFYGVMLL